MKTTKTSAKNPEPRELDLTASLTIEAAPEGAGDVGKPRNRRFTMVAYTGGSMRIAGFSYPVVVDLAGLDLARASFPVFVGHQQDPDYLLGQADRVEVVGTNLVASGDVIDVAPKAQQVVEAHDRGFRWQVRSSWRGRPSWARSASCSAGRTGTRPQPSRPGRPARRTQSWTRT